MKRSASALLLLVALSLPSAVFGIGYGELIALPSAGSWSVASGARTDAAPQAVGSIEIRGIGKFTYDPSTIQTVRPDLFADGRFSAFDALLQLAASGQIELAYAYDDRETTYVAQSINGIEGWWYDVLLPGGAYERTTQRMDAYPIKEGSSIYVYLEDPARLAAIHESFREETAKLAADGGRVIVPVVTIKGPRSTATFENVAVTAHDSRPDLFRSGAITALDVLLSLGEQGRIAGLDLTWHTMVDDVENVNHYMVDWISIPDVLGDPDSSCGYMHSAATEGLRPFVTPHSHATTAIHLSPDAELLVSPEYVEWQWLCAAP